MYCFLAALAWFYFALDIPASTFCCLRFQPIGRMPLNRNSYQLTPGAHTGLAEEFLDDGFHGTLRGIQRQGDLLVGEAV
jgi:hypothetical protein